MLCLYRLVRHCHFLAVNLKFLGFHLNLYRSEAEQEAVLDDEVKPPVTVRGVSAVAVKL